MRERGPLHRPGSGSCPPERGHLSIPLFIHAASISVLRPIENKLLLIDPTGVIVLEHIKYGDHITKTGDGARGAIRQVVAVAQ
jgi:hypothetical protein